MKDPADIRTQELIDPVPRGRGRPPTGHALTDAERARRYRLRKKAKKSETATLDATQSQRVADLVGALDTVTELALAGKKFPKEVVKGLVRLLSDQK